MPDADLLARIDAFDFKALHPNVRFGTASDRYVGWVGQIYSEELGAQAKSRPKKIGGKTFREDVLPVESVGEYFDRLDILEIDYTFYAPLRTADGDVARTSHVLAEHARFAPDDALFLLKVPEAFTAPKVRRAGGYQVNPTYLDAAAYRAQFLDPAKALLGSRLAGVLFEQGYQRVSDTPPQEVFVEQLAQFFDASGGANEVPHHLEIRSGHLLGARLADWATSAGVGIALSHWTWLPSLAEQWQKAGRRATALGDEIVIRLLTPRNVKYADAYAQAHPFDAVIPEVAESAGAAAMLEDTAQVIRDASREGATVNVLANNRAWGNAPRLLQEVARRVVG